MSAVTDGFLAKAHECLRKSASMIELWPDEGGRTAYLAGFHAAQAMIFSKTGKISKTHSGVHAQFALCTRTRSDFDDDLRAFLGRAYTLKTLADYDASEDRGVSREDADNALSVATRLVASVETILANEGSDPPLFEDNRA